MPSLRQAGSGVLYALLSIVLVLGSLSLALAERNATTQRPATASPLPANTGTTSPAQGTGNAGATLAPSAQLTAAPSLPPATQTAAMTYPSLAPTRVPPTSTHAAGVQCGPPSGWLKNYVVQPGDTMFHVAVLYRTTVPVIQRANCKTSYVIFTGERLWVPNVSTATAGVTIIPPFFDTPTDEPTFIVTETPIYFTPTAVPSDTPTPTEVPTDTATPGP